MRTTFINSRIEESFIHDGYYVVNLLSPIELGEVRKGIKDLGYGIDSERKLRISLYDESTEKKNEIFEELSPIFQNVANTFLQNYILIRMGIFDKLPGGGEIKAHQQPNLVDESKYRSLTIWVPLSETTVEMGTLHVVKYSHKIFDRVRPVNDCCRFEKVSEKTMKKYSIPLELKNGQAAIFDDRIIHWSPPNKSSRTRTAVQLEFIPRDTKPVMYYRINDKEISKYIVDKNYFREVVFPSKKPNNLQAIETLTQPCIGYNNKQFISSMQDFNPYKTL